MIPNTLIEVNPDSLPRGIYINGDAIPNPEEFIQEATELKHNRFFELLTADAKTRAYKDGFLDTEDWETTLGAKGWFGCAANMEKLLQDIIDFK